MGTPYHHYIIADDWIIPPESEIYYSERVLRLPCYQPNDRKREIAPVRPTRAEAGLPENAFVFCCFNGSQKISRFTFERWLEILSRVPGSVLWLLDTSDTAKQRLRDVAAAHGVSPERLIFAPRQGNAQHLARYPLADLFLDTAPYGAHTTASDALWMGVPVLTLSGRSFASRVCGSLTRSAGLADLVVTRAQDYVERAVALGHDRAMIKRYKDALDANRTTCDLFNMELLVARLEGLYSQMSEEYRSGNLPKPNLTNLSAYHEAAVSHDHDAEEMLGVDDYTSFYRRRLSRLHFARPLHVDGRLWTSAEVERAERRPILDNDARTEGLGTAFTPLKRRAV